MRALVTGASGFVGRYLVDALRAQGAHVVACAGPNQDEDGFLPLDVLDAAAVRAAVEQSDPAVVFHLAAQTFVPDSFAQPLETYRTNALGTAVLAQAVREHARARGTAGARLIFTSSAEVYGRRDPAEFPLRESLETRPATPYAGSKAAAEAMLLSECRSLGLDAVVTRSFNHIGPGQSTRFAVAGLAEQLARVACGHERVLLVGNLEAARDFLDVRDVVAAYLALARDGRSGEIYNVCSGTAVTIKEVLRQLITIARVPVEVREDSERMRPVDVPVFVGSAQKIEAETGWRPAIGLSRSLREIYEAAVAAQRDGAAAAGKAAPQP